VGLRGVGILEVDRQEDSKLIGWGQSHSIRCVKTDCPVLPVISFDFVF
jgi:hypothetical protein